MLFSIKKLIYRLLKIPFFSSSREYWEERYKYGGNSGSGSYNQLAVFKANVINEFVNKKGIQSVMELGCGDGNQLDLYDFNNYHGYDVSRSIIDYCRNKFVNDRSKRFDLLESYEENKKYDLTLSIDVLYHLTEDSVFESHLSMLFSSSKKYVIIYSSDKKNTSSIEPIHIKEREFSKWINKHIDDFKLIEHIKNKYPYHPDNSDETSICDFFIYEKLQ